MSATPSTETGKARVGQGVAAALQREAALHIDAAQIRAAKALDRLREELVALYGGHRLGKRLLWRCLPFKSVRKHTPSGLYLWGAPGGGKSMLMDMFLSSVEATPALAALTRRRTHFLPFMEEMHESIERLNRSSVRDPVAGLAAKVARESRLLCFDEFVVEDIADAMLLGRLFAALRRHGLVLVATSNFAPEDLYKDGFKRDSFLPFLELLRQTVVEVPVHADADYRSRALASEGRELWFSDKAGKSRMLEIFVQFTEHCREDRILPCAGRALLLQREGAPSGALRAKGLRRGVVMCGFVDLCQTPRGVRDYRALLECCDLLFLADFPVLDEVQRNAAKRFMRLVDMFYERRAIVLCHSPAVSPSVLYGGDSHAKEFRRTVSRLEEMMARAHALL